MRALILFNVDFCAWPLAVLEALAGRLPQISVTGVVTIDQSVTRNIAAQSVVPVRPLHCLSELEPTWLERPARPDAIQRYQQQLGRQAVSDIVSSDRELSAGWVSGAVTPETPLRRSARDPARSVAYVLGLLDFFNELYTENQFDFVLSFPTQDAPSVAAGVVARHFGVPFLNLKAIGFLAKSCLFDDVKGMAPCFRTLFDAAERDPGSLEPDLSQARAALAAFRAQPVAPDYMRVANASVFERPTLLTLALLLHQTMTSRIPDSVRYPFPLARLKWEIGRWLRSKRDLGHPAFRPIAALAGKPFVYFPLHYEPEASTMVAAPEATNQLALIENLAKSIPAGFQIAVKEHLPMLGRRPRGFYERLALMPRVVLISPSEASFRCIAEAELTAVITGTAGFEAVLLGRPALFLGPSPIQIIGEGFVRCENPAEFAAAIDLALETPAAKDATLVRFLAALFAQSVDLKADMVWGGTGSVTPDRVKSQEQTSARIADLILEALANRRSAAGDAGGVEAEPSDLHSKSARAR